MVPGTKLKRYQVPKTIKPQEKIYDLAVLQAGVNKEDVVYVDDRQDLIDVAASYGIKSVKFEAIGQVKNEFLRLGILFNEKNVSIQT